MVAGTLTAAAAETATEIETGPATEADAASQAEHTGDMSDLDDLADEMGEQISHLETEQDKLEDSIMHHTVELVGCQRWVREFFGEHGE